MILPHLFLYAYLPISRTTKKARTESQESMKLKQALFLGRSVFLIPPLKIVFSDIIGKGGNLLTNQLAQKSTPLTGTESAARDVLV
jgi:hypothetical protein